jgi:hypothetical protein
MQWRSMTPIMQIGITVSALIVACSIAYYTGASARSASNSALVQVGIAVLRADPQKEPQVMAAREWALNLIDANAGGVKFSPEAREELLQQSLGYVDTYGYGYSDVSPDRPPAISK